MKPTKQYNIVSYEDKNLQSETKSWPEVSAAMPKGILKVAEADGPLVDEATPTCPAIVDTWYEFKSSLRITLLAGGGMIRLREGG